MNKSNTTLATRKGMSTLARPKFAPGMLLQHEDLEQLNYYTRDLSRLLFRSLFGCGVTCGLVVTTDVECGKLKINVASGVALSCSGDPIEVPSSVSVLLDRDCHPEMGDTLWITLCGTVKCCAPRTSMCEGDDDETKSECTRERAGYEIRVESARPDCVCGCPEPQNDLGNNNKPTDPQNPTPGTPPTPIPRKIDGDAVDCKCANPEDPCYVDHYAGKCGCHCDDCDDCSCKCVLLARLNFDEANNKWVADHSVRRFVRPVLMRDPQVAEEQVEEPEEPQKPEQPEQPEQPVEGSAARASSKAARTSKKTEPTS